MIHIRYIREVLEVIQDLRVALDIEDEPNPFHPHLFSLAFFGFASITMPVMALYIFGVERKQAVKDISHAIIKSYFQLEEK